MSESVLPVAVPARYQANEDADSSPVWNFAIGSNLKSSVFLGRRGLHPLESLPGHLRDHTLAMVQPGMPFLEPVFASILPHSGAVCHGMLYLLTRKEFNRLLASEGVVAGRRVGGYVPVEVEAQAHRGHEPGTFNSDSWATPFAAIHEPHHHRCARALA